MDERTKKAKLKMRNLKYKFLISCTWIGIKSAITLILLNLVITALHVSFVPSTFVTMALSFLAALYTLHMVTVEFEEARVKMFTELVSILSAEQREDSNDVQNL
jgi:hypothetical protein